MLTNFACTCKSCAAPLNVKNIFSLITCSRCGTTQYFSNSKLIEEPFILGNQTIGGSLDLVDRKREMNGAYEHASYGYARIIGIDILKFFPNELDVLLCVIRADHHLNAEGRGQDFYITLLTDIYNSLDKAGKQEVAGTINSVMGMILYHNKKIDIVMPAWLKFLFPLDLDDRLFALKNMFTPYSSSGFNAIGREKVRRSIHKLYDLYCEVDSNHWIYRDSISEIQFKYLQEFSTMAKECGVEWHGDDLVDGTLVRESGKTSSFTDNLTGCVIIILGLAFLGGIGYGIFRFFR